MAHNIHWKCQNIKSQSTPSNNRAINIKPAISLIRFVRKTDSQSVELVAIKHVCGAEKKDSCTSSGKNKNKKIKTTHIILCSSDGNECKWRMKLFFSSIYAAAVVVVAVDACADAIVGRYLQIYTVTNEAGISK